MVFGEITTKDDNNVGGFPSGSVHMYMNLQCNSIRLFKINSTFYITHTHIGLGEIWWLVLIKTHKPLFIFDLFQFVYTKILQSVENQNV